jgi:hypothetical protein
VLEVDWPTAAVEDDAYGVEPNPAVEGEVLALGHPGAGQAADLQLLAAVDREDRALGSMRGPGSGGLDLDEHQVCAVEGDEVELAVPRAGIALEDLPTAGLQAGGNELLGEVAGPLALMGHVPARAWR